MLALTIVHAFGPYRVGDEVTDPAEVERLSSGSTAQNVVRVMRPDLEPEPTVEAEPEKPADPPTLKGAAKPDPKPAAKADDADRA